MTSSLFWIASSRADISNARAALKTFSQEGVLDELGFLVLLSAISDRLYPAVSTIMTRARYLVFVPAIYRHIEDKGLGIRREPDDLGRDFQYKLRNALMATDAESDGIIGRESGRRVERTPSNTYWNALIQLGIATASMSEAAYQRGLADPASRRGKDDDESYTSEGSLPFWDPSFATAEALPVSGEFPSKTSFDLTRREARDLAVRYANISPAGGTSLIAHLLEIGADSGRPPEFAHPWAVPGLSGNLKSIIDHARKLSLFARGATLQYHAMLHEMRRSQDAGTEAAFVAWWNDARQELMEWNLTEFGRLDFFAGVKRPGDLLFLHQWIESWRSSRTGSAAFHNGDSRTLLRKREYEIRRHKGRLHSVYQRDNWKAPAGYNPSERYALTYRHRVGTQFAVDITSGLTA